MKHLLLSLFCPLFVFYAYGQPDKNGTEYQQFYLSLHAGWDFALGSSSTELSDKLTIPPTKRGFSPGFDGAWFFSNNYGVGVKYAFYTSKYKKESFLEYTEHTYDYPVYEYKSLVFKERTHLLGPAFYARWLLGDSRWTRYGKCGCGRAT